MTIVNNPTVGAPLAFSKQWESIDWRAVKAQVYKLQMRIAKAIRSGCHNKAKALQWILTNSFYAKILAIKRITQNRGKNTPGCRRHVKIRAEATPYDYKYRDYFKERDLKQRKS